MLWQGKATASSAETQDNSDSGLLGMLVEAALTQVLESVSDKGFDIAAITANRLLSSEAYNGLLHGPRSPKYGQPAKSEKPITYLSCCLLMYATAFLHVSLNNKKPHTCSTQSAT